MSLRKNLRRAKRLSGRLRNPFYRLRCNRIGRGSYVARNVALRNCSIEAYCYIGENSALNCVEMGPYCSVAPGVQIGGMGHAYEALSTSAFLARGHKANVPTVIGHDVWIGAQCYIKQGVRIGDGAVIGAQALVTKDVAPYTVVIGSPARVYKQRFDDATVAALNESRYWELPPKQAREVLNKIPRP